MTKYAAVQDTRKVGDIITLDRVDLRETPLCYCSLDCGFMGSMVAEVEPVSEPFQNSRVVNVSNNVQRTILAERSLTSLKVQIIAINVK